MILNFQKRVLMLFVSIAVVSVLVLAQTNSIDSEVRVVSNKLEVHTPNSNLGAELLMKGVKKPIGQRTPWFALKTNIIHDLSTTLNLGVEFGLSQRLTLDLPVSVNPWKFSDDKKLNLTLVQPELRFWTGEAFNGHFIGFNLMYANFNVGGIEVPFNLWRDLETYRYEGNIYGGGISYGYHWFLGKRWSMEATIGLGYMHSRYDKYVYRKCGKFLGEGMKNYFGPTKLGLSLIYIIK